jgi:hypothetical protein
MVLVPGSTTVPPQQPVQAHVQAHEQAHEHWQRWQRRQPWQRWQPWQRLQAQLHAQLHAHEQLQRLWWWNRNSGVSAPPVSAIINTTLYISKPPAIKEGSQPTRNTKTHFWAWSQLLLAWKTARIGSRFSPFSLAESEPYVMDSKDSQNKSQQ